VDRGLAARKAAAGPEFIERFGSPTRRLHWTLGVLYLLLLLSGLTNFWPEAKAFQLADTRVFAWLHVVLGWALVVSIALLVLPLLTERSLRRDLRELLRVGLGDYLWLQHVALRAMGSASRPPRAAKFNAGQKLNALVSALLLAGLVASGVVLGINYLSKSVFEVSFVEGVFPWHTALALLAIPPLLGHLYLALIHPSTREALRGMVLGRVRRDWARQHHPAWVEQVEQAERSGAGD
jgi:formate dehydrogenase subunit gamma